MRPDAKLCPRHIVETLSRYTQQGLETGGILKAVLSNDLLQTFLRADEDNMAALPHIMAYIYNELPGNSWGSPEKVAAFLEKTFQPFV